ncbi:MAG: cache domain-containing protein [Desulfobacteraceae bacterium]
MFKDLSIRVKLLLYYSLVFTISLCMCTVLLYFSIQKTITENIENELENTTQVILNMVRTAADVSIKNRLRAIAEKNREIAEYYYRQFQSGAISEEEAKQLAANLYLNQTIGKSGYTYCLDSSGVVLIHPEDELINISVAQHEFVRRQVQLKEGYLNYQWKNPGEKDFRPKALYMTYFEPWDWIISVTSYRREFKDLVNVDDFKASILDLHFGETGYSFVIDRTGTAIIHPVLEGVNILEDKSLPDEYLQAMIARKKGKISYPWKNPNEKKQRDKLVIFNYIPEYDWVVASSSYLEEFYRPLTTIRNIMLATVVVTLLLIVLLAHFISATITKPLRRLMGHFNHIGEADFAQRMRWDSKDELGQLATYFNKFMAQLEVYSTDLNDEIKHSRQVEAALRESEGRYRSVMEAAPDPIVVYNMKGEVSFFNPAFTRVFGWTLDECIGRRMDHFVPHENWPETQRLIDKALNGEALTSVETRRFNKNGEIVPVTISGDTYRDDRGQLAGSVIILRDITNSKRLRRRIMDISERERQNFGRDLHDDLGPHLIGIQGLCSVLGSNLHEESSGQVALSKQIQALIEDAIDKTRALARGLFPAHLVSQGLNLALDDLASRTASTTAAACVFNGDESVELSDSSLATHLYFIAQEAVANAVKHAAASRIVIELSKAMDTLHLSVSDDGCGLDLTGSTDGIGLQIMEYRAKLIGAVINIDATPQHGTTVRIQLKRSDETGEPN